MSQLTILRGGKANLGAFQVKRMLPAPMKQMVGPFIFMDHGGPARVSYQDFDGVPEHPHAGLSTFTLMLAGSQLHRDSAGFEQVFHQSDVALMTSGKGITHEELPDPADREADREMHFVQMWLALPDSHEQMDPTFEYHPAASLPVHEKDGAHVTLLMGQGWGMTAPTTCYADTIFADIQLQAGAQLLIDQNAEERAFYLIDGSAAIDDQEVADGSRLTLIPPGTQPVLSSESGARLIMLGGAAFISKRYIKWNFVASSKEMIDDHMTRWKAGDWPSIR